MKILYYLAMVLLVLGMCITILPSMLIVLTTGFDPINPQFRAWNNLRNKL